MKKVFIKGYFKNNLGDDLFFKILSSRYNNEFFAVCSPKYNYFNRYNNIIFNKSYIIYYFYRILERILKKKNYMEKSKLSDIDVIVNIGGSIFIENKSSGICELKNQFDFYKNRPYFILGSNFGSYINEFYKEFIKNNLFACAKDVCFRDFKSFNMFKDLPNVRVAPDIVFSLDTSSIKITNSKKIIISVIDCSSRFSEDIVSKYEQTIIDIIYYFDNLGYTIILMSFCKFEGDEVAIEKIINKIDKSKLKRDLEEYFYNGNINGALDIIGDSQIIFGSRFHANILGLLLGITIFPIAYSDKTVNVLNDIGFEGKIIDIRNIDKFSVNDISDEDLTYKCNVDVYKKDALNHFIELDKILRRR